LLSLKKRLDIKITQIVESIGPGGAFSGVAYNLGREFSKKGVEVGVVTGKVIKPPDRKMEIHLVFPKLMSLMRKTESLYIVNKLIAILIVPLFHFFALRYVKKNGEKLGIVIDYTATGVDAMRISGCVLEMIRIRWLQGERAFLLYPLNWYRVIVEKLRYSSRRFKKGIAVSNKVKRDIVDWYNVPEQDITVIPNGVDIETFHPRNSAFKTEIRERYNIPLDVSLFVFVGHNFRLKGLGPAIQALAKVSNAYLLVIGNGNVSTFAKLAKKLKVEDKVVFVGPIGKDLNKFYGASDVFLFPSSYEAFPLVSLEALASGLPVLATRVGGVEDYLVDGYNGFFIEREPSDIANKIQLILSDNALKRKLGENARKTAEELNWKNIAARYLDFLAKIAQDKEDDK